VGTQQEKLALFSLPPNSPGPNPNELIWDGLKTHGAERKLITSLMQLRQMIVSLMR
jgi:transposase